MNGDEDRAIAIVLDSIAAVLRSIADNALTRIEEERHARYSIPYRHKLHEKLKEDARAAVERQARSVAPTICEGLRLPEVPTQELEAHAARTDVYQYWVFSGRIDSDRPPPTKPTRVVEYERECEQFANAFRVCAAQASYDWSDPTIQAAISEEIAQRRLEKGGRTPRLRKERGRGTELHRPAYLVGDEPVFDEQTAGAADARHARERLRAAVWDRLGLRLVLREDLYGGDNDVAARARINERDGHRGDVETMVALLQRLGYDVYPGDVGVQGIYAMADLVAYREDDGDVLFVECLSKASIKHGAHLKKLRLAQAVPFCFVGAVPEGFVADLPATAFAITGPGSPRMSGGEWVPFFWRRGRGVPVPLEVRARRARNVTRLTFAMPELRLPEDVAGFVSAALRTRVVLPDLWSLKHPRPWRGTVPFERVGMPDSSYRITSPRSDLLIRLGAQVNDGGRLVGELRGTGHALLYVCQILSDAGLTVNIIDAD